MGDDGAGFDPAAVPPRRYGVVGMRERAAELGGRLTVDSTPGEGTLVTLRIPLHPATAAPAPRRSAQGVPA